MHSQTRLQLFVCIRLFRNSDSYFLTQIQNPPTSGTPSCEKQQKFAKLKIAMYDGTRKHDDFVLRSLEILSRSSFEDVYRQMRILAVLSEQ